jgi:Uma2 family endonuclease
VGERDEDIDTVLQPDLSVICDPGKLDDQGCKGVPDLVIEVLSPETAKRDLTVKLSIYEKAGVLEYWVVHPGDKTVMIFTLNEKGEYVKPKVYAEKDEIPVNIFQDLIIYLESVFA